MPVDRVTLEIPDANLKIDLWKSFQLKRDWTNANTSWHCTVADGNYKEIRRKVQNGMVVYFKINDTVQSTGYVEHMEVNYDDDSGTLLTLGGRDCLGPACNSCIDIQKFTFADTETIRDVAKKILLSYGFTDVKVDDTINRQKITGKVVQFSFDNELDKIINAPLNKKWRPHTSEGAYQFLERIGKRFGFHVWCSADGKTVFCGTPDYKSPPVNSIFKYEKNSPLVNNNNVLSGSFKFNINEQPAVLVALGNGGGGNKRWQAIKNIRVNELLVSDPPSPAVQEIIDRYVKIGAKVIPRNKNISVPEIIVPITDKVVLGVVVDDESKNHAQLTNFVNTSMARLQSQMINVNYRVFGLSQNGAIWAPNTSVNVYDETLDIYQTMWIKSVEFNKTVGGGTVTDLECLIPYTLDLFPSAD